jgi:phosphatidylserine/phosphatidylglycerophosphate/cardiolipin synthase-like enzyme
MTIPKLYQEKLGMRIFLILGLIALTRVFCSGQFNLFIQQTTISQMSITIPAGSGERYLLVLDRDSTRIDSIFLQNCANGCVQQLEDLNPAHIYLLQLFRNQQIQDERWAITSSTSKGWIEVYFTNPVDQRQSNGALPTGVSGAVLEEAIVNAINAAHTSIDVMLYNINRRPISTALIAAHNRGVKIRYLTSDDTANSALSNPTPDFPILIGNLGSGLMHNKVFVIDANDPDRALVITGATNMTTNQIYTDHNNTLFIQDQSLARVYEKEVDEMWGSRDVLPNPSRSRFGRQKRDDTPHEVYIHGQLFEVYFSPSDNTTFHMVNALNSARYDCYFALLLITRSNLAASLINLKNRGIDVKGIVNNQSENGTEFFNLQQAGVFLLHYFPSRQLHHKYAIIDAGALGARPKVITGSHNWSNNAENINDENTLIIHRADVVNIFFQEFQARWCEVFTGDDCKLVTSIEEKQLSTADIRCHYDLQGQQWYIWYDQPDMIRKVLIWDMQGRLIYAKTGLSHVGGAHPLILGLSALTPGQYMLTVETEKGSASIKGMVY